MWSAQTPIVWHVQETFESEHVHVWRLSSRQGYRRTTDLLLKWAANTDADLAGYDVRLGSGWDSGVLVGQTAGTQLVHDQNESGQYNYFIRAIDTSGKYSTHVTTFLLFLLAPSSVRQFDVVQSANRLEFRWLSAPSGDAGEVSCEQMSKDAVQTRLMLIELQRWLRLLEVPRSRLGLVLD